MKTEEDIKKRINGWQVQLDLPLTTKPNAASQIEMVCKIKAKAKIDELKWVLDE